MSRSGQWIYPEFGSREPLVYSQSGVSLDLEPAPGLGSGPSCGAELAAWRVDAFSGEAASARSRILSGNCLQVARWILTRLPHPARWNWGQEYKVSRLYGGLHCCALTFTLTVSFIFSMAIAVCTNGRQPNQSLPIRIFLLGIWKPDSGTLIS